ncbi:ARM repeat-containing protein [Violaceomyces palustris]|uniref:ARM repeat-containing protein n=1 Tax=Violaceomyces palustris TaxID=1673888 RepID=A0ACD0NW97_9BASI|nr:ARM repeat-containing protein [Violaceomyces palustris]
MDPALQKALLDRVYDKRKAATLDLEKQVRECLSKGDRARVNLIVQQLCSLLSSSPQNVNARNGGLIGLAGIGIALGLEIAPYLEQIAKPVLACFSDPDSKIRYFACESFYNIAKVCKGEILVYFNEIFDALSKLAADSEISVKNGAELLDRLLKDIVCEAAPHYVSQYQDIGLIRARQDAAVGHVGGPAELDVAREKAHASKMGGFGDDADAAVTANNKVFSLARFIPLLAERMYVLSPFTRNYLVSWVTVLDSVPDLELVSYLPSFLDGLLKYLSDPNTDVRVATANVLADFLREIREAAEASAQRSEFERRKLEKERSAAERKAEEERRKKATTDGGTDSGRSGSPVKPGAAAESTDVEDRGSEEKQSRSGSVIEKEDEGEEEDEEIWVPGQEVRIDYAAIMEILINHIGYPDEEIQATTLQWIAELLLVVKDVVVPFTPRLIPAILPSLAHHSPAIANAANSTNLNLYRVIQQLPAPPQPVVTNRQSASSLLESKGGRDRIGAKSPATVSTARSEKTTTAGVGRSSGSIGSAKEMFSPPLSPRLRSPPSTVTEPENALSMTAVVSQDDAREDKQAAVESDPFDYQVTVNALTLQLLDEHEETRVTALEWLLMLHSKCPRKILSMDDGTFPALLKTLSDPSEEVIRCDLRLLAQISSASEDAYFHSFMANLLSLFSTDRRLLETRGSLIIRQLCASLHTERIFRTLAEILEKDEDLEFASIMVQNLNVILLTSPELADFRKRLKNLDSSKDGQMLFSSLYRSWCHNAVATFSLCLLAQAYEHASNLLNIFAEQLEMTVSLLIQIDKLVQLLESPIFTSLRLQLLEPEKYPYLFKCLYGILMLLPQSSAFVTLRNRLNAVSGMGFLHAIPRSAYLASSSSSSTVGAASGKSGSSASGSGVVGSGGSGGGVGVGGGGGVGGMGKREEIRWNELLIHFKVVQMRHERSRKLAASGGGGGGAGGGGTGGGGSMARSSVNGILSVGNSSGGGMDGLSNEISSTSISSNRGGSRRRVSVNSGNNSNPSGGAGGGVGGMMGLGHRFSIAGHQNHANPSSPSNVGGGGGGSPLNPNHRNSPRNSNESSSNTGGGGGGGGGVGFFGMNLGGGGGGSSSTTTGLQPNERSSGTRSTSPSNTRRSQYGNSPSLASHPRSLGTKTNVNGGSNSSGR